MKENTDNPDICISEFVLVELYRLLRNPTLNEYPLNGKQAVSIIENYRQHPRWRIIGFTDKSSALHHKIWATMAQIKISYRQIYDVRLAYTLLDHGVKEFATANVKDFEKLGFKKVWNPLS